jgi:hypothetical protein
MLRAFLIAGVLAVLPAAVADARTRTIDVGRGEIVVLYSGSGGVSHLNGEQCVGTNPCTAFGAESFTASWDAMAIADRHGHIAADDTTLFANALEDFRPDEGSPLPPPKPTDCTATIGDKDGRYRGGTSVTTTTRSIGVQMTLPVDSNWLRLKHTTNPDVCTWGESVTAGAIFGAQSYGPADAEPKAQKALARVLAPQLAIRKSDKTVTKRFDFLYHRAPPHTVGPYSLTIIHIESTVTVVNQCRRFDETHGRCVKYNR